MAPGPWITRDLKECVLASDYDALAARLAEADALLREARQRTQNLLHRQHGDQIIMNPDDYLRATLSLLDAALGTPSAKPTEGA
jgi:hypothetical protein